MRSTIGGKYVHTPIYISSSLTSLRQYYYHNEVNLLLLLLSLLLLLLTKQRPLNTTKHVYYTHTHTYIYIGNLLTTCSGRNGPSLDNTYIKILY